MTRAESAGLLAILAVLFTMIEVPVPATPGVTEEPAPVTWEELQWLEVEDEENALAAATTKARAWFFSSPQPPRRVPQIQAYL